VHFEAHKVSSAKTHFAFRGDIWDAGASIDHSSPAWTTSIEDVLTCGLANRISGNNAMRVLAMGK
jgi:hypothetical protein